MHEYEHIGIVLVRTHVRTHIIGSSADVNHLWNCGGNATTFPPTFFAFSTNLCCKISDFRLSTIFYVILNHINLLINEYTCYINENFVIKLGASSRLCQQRLTLFVLINGASANTNIQIYLDDVWYLLKFLYSEI